MTGRAGHRILVRRSRGIPGIYDNAVRDAAVAALRAAGASAPCHIEIGLVSADEMRRHNLAHRGKDSATDVLSFPSLEATPEARSSDGLLNNAAILDYIDGRIFLGEIMISPSAAEAQGVELGHSTHREMAFLAVHGVLHLLGYDHDAGIDMERIMIDKQKEIISILFPQER